MCLPRRLCFSEKKEKGMMKWKPGKETEKAPPRTVRKVLLRPFGFLLGSVND